MRCASWLLVASFVLPVPARALTTGQMNAVARTYPPSCLSAPLPDQPSGPTFSRTTMLASVDRDTLEYAGFEPIDVTVWRVPCTDGHAALLLRIARAAGAEPSRAAQFPFQYRLRARQGGVTGTLRLAQEPNARLSSVQPDGLIGSAVTFVVENVPSATATSMSADPALPPGVNTVVFDVDQPLGGRRFRRDAGRRRQLGRARRDSQGAVPACERVARNAGAVMHDRQQRPTSHTP